MFEFEIWEEKCIIPFKRINIFIFDVNLILGKNSINIQRNIDQTNIIYNQKFDYFIEAMTENEEKEKRDALYKDALALYSDKKLFSFLLPLFF